MPAPSRFGLLRSTDAHVSRVQDQIANTLTPVANAVNQTPIGGAAPPSWISPDLVADFVAVATMAPAYNRDALGYTWLKLGVTTAAGSAANASVCVLKQGYRPLGNETVVLPGTNSTTLAYSPISVDPSGVVRSLVALAAGDTLKVYGAFLAAT